IDDQYRRRRRPHEQAHVGEWRLIEGHIDGRWRCLAGAKRLHITGDADDLASRGYGIGLVLRALPSPTERDAFADRTLIGKVLADERITLGWGRQQIGRAHV